MDLDVRASWSSFLASYTKFAHTGVGGTGGGGR